jgi:rhamnosyltransferase
MKLVAVVSSYRPDASVHASIAAIRYDVEDVIVVDDGSGNDFDDLLSGVRDLGVEVIRLAVNAGLATALNTGCRRAFDELAATHVITFDQDTVPVGAYSRQLLEAERTALDAGLPVGLVGAGRINGATVRSTERVVEGISRAEEPIQSGLLIPAGTWSRLGELRDDLFIDCIDTEYALRGSSVGLLAVVADAAELAHAIGTGHDSNPRRRSQISLHSALRQYYMTRNRLTVYRMYGRQNVRWLLRSIALESRDLFRNVRYGTTPSLHLRAAASGVAHALSRRLGRAPARLESSLTHRAVGSDR